jgi:hypothetical protein
VSELMCEQRFQIVRALALWSGESGGRGKECLPVIPEKYVGVEDLPHERRWPTRADGSPGGCRRDYACEGQYATCESHARLVKTDCVQSVDIVILIVGARIRGARLRDCCDQPGMSCTVKCRAGNPSPRLQTNLKSLARFRLSDPEFPVQPQSESSHRSSKATCSSEG